MAHINPYITFNGNCLEAFNFYKSVFGGEFQYVGKFKDMPPVDGKSVSPTNGDLIMHISLPIKGESILMGSDSIEEYGGVPIAGTNFNISIKADTKEEADKIFNGLSAGGKTTMPMNTTFWGSYFGRLTDKFGVQWMMSFDKSQEK